MPTLLAYPDKTLTATLSGGSWEGGIPLNNLKNPLLSKVARSTNALEASTKFDADLGASEEVRIIALLKHNLSLAGRVRVRGYLEAGKTTLLYDSARLTNLVTYSEDFTQTIWSKTRCTISSDAIIAPNGTLTADKVIEDTTTTATHGVIHSATGHVVKIGDRIKYLFFAKAGERAIVAVVPSSSIVGSGNSVSFDLSSGGVSSIGSGASVRNVGMVDVGNGWWLCLCDFISIANTTANFNAYIKLTLTGSSSYTGDGVSGLYIWGATFTINAPVVPVMEEVYFGTYGFIGHQVWPTSMVESDKVNQPNNYIFPISKTNARYWLIEISDPTNAAGYIQLGRCWIGPAPFEPSFGLAYGAGLGYVSGDILASTPYGVIWGDRRDQKRVTSVNFEVLSAEEKRKALIMQKVLGKAGELLYVMNTNASAEDMLLEAFPGRIESASPITHPYFANHSMPIQIKEII